MREDQKELEEQSNKEGKELEEQSNKEERELDNPDLLYLNPEPVFLINEAPTAKHLSYAQEFGIPVVVILSNKLLQGMPERIMWQHMNIPELDFVCVDWSGDHSNVPFIKNKWRKIVKDHHKEVRDNLKTTYEKAGKNFVPAQAHENLPPFLKILFDNIKKSKDEGDDGMQFIMPLVPPPE